MSPRLIGPELPVDPRNPLGYDKSKATVYDIIEDPCLDFNHTLSWVFWVAYEAAGDCSTFEQVRHIRHLLLLGLQRREMVSNVRVPEWDFVVEVAGGDDFYGLLLRKQHGEYAKPDTDFWHIVGHVLDDDAIADAIVLNKELREPAPRAPISPFGPADCVMPGSYRFPPRVGNEVSSPFTPYRHVRLVKNPKEDRYAKWRKQLESTSNVFEVQMLIERACPMSMNAKDFNYFIHLCAAKSHALLREESRVLPVRT